MYKDISLLGSIEVNAYHVILKRSCEALRVVRSRIKRAVWPLSQATLPRTEAAMLRQGTMTS